MNELQLNLQKYFGYENFKSGQQEIIQEVLNNHHVIALLPTGMGKSLTYQLPGILMDGLIIIVSPLLSLMEDQVDQMKKLGLKKTVALNSIKSAKEKAAILQRIHQFKYVFLSPEMLAQKEVLQTLQLVKVSLLVIDEAHCIAQWGYDFRPDYLRLQQWIKYFPNTPRLALTATAAESVVEEIRTTLQMGHATIIRVPLNRENIYYHQEIIDSEEKKLQRIHELLMQAKASGIIYCQSRKKADDYAKIFQQRGFSIAAYHAGIDMEDRAIIQQQFLQNELTWIAATSAFGMGVHKANVRMIIHDHLPGSVAEYVQEAGRAGRDGQPACSIALINEDDVQKTIFTKTNDLLEENDLQLLNMGKTVDELVQDGWLSETKGRTLAYWSSKMSRDELVHHLNGMRSTKVREIFQMQKIFFQQNCIRESLLRYFNESLEKTQQLCCSKCEDLIETFKWEDVKEKTSSQSWQERLQSLLQ